MDYADILVGRIGELCRQRGISQNRLAAMSGIRQSTVNNIFAGMSKNPRIQTLHKIANALGMTLAEFLDVEELNAYSFADQDDED